MNLSASPNSFNQKTQPAGTPAPDGTRGSGGATGVDGELLGLHARLCELQSDPTARAAMLNVPVAVDAAWLDGRMLPVLRAHAKALRAAISTLEYDKN